MAKSSINEASTIQHKMRSELQRVASFSSFPSLKIKVFLTRLAKSGFYYIGNGKGSLTKCYACGITYERWESGDDPNVIHQLISPECVHLYQISLCSVNNHRLGHGVELIANGDDRSSVNAAVQTESIQIGIQSENLPIERPLEPVKIHHAELPGSILISGTTTTVQQTQDKNAQVVGIGGRSGSIQRELDPACIADKLSEMGFQNQDILRAMKNVEENHGQRNFMSMSGVLGVLVMQINEEETNNPCPGNCRGQSNTAASSNDISANEFKRLLEENRRLRMKMICNMCLWRHVGLVCMPCSHAVICEECLDCTRKCPVCHEYIDGTVKINIDDSFLVFQL